MKNLRSSGLIQAAHMSPKAYDVIATKAAIAMICCSQTSATS